MAKDRMSTKNSSKEKFATKATSKDTIKTDESIVESLVDNAAVSVNIAEPEEFVEELDGRKKSIRDLPPIERRVTVEHHGRRSTVDRDRRVTLERHPTRKQSTVQSRRQTTCRQKTSRCMKRFCLYLLSYVGLTCIVVAYSVLGGFVFVALESANENDVQGKAMELREKTTTRLDEVIEYMLTYHKDWRTVNFTGSYNLTNEVLGILRDFQVQTYGLVSKEGWSGVVDVTEGENKWTFAGGLLYSVTVITTIGYGAVTPKTTAGRAITMVYALIGIPLTVLCISKIGTAMASLFRALYGGTFCRECRHTFFNSVKNKPNTVANGIEVEKDSGSEGDEVVTVGHSHQQTEVPIIICLLLVTWYIVFGAILFTIWEKEWTYFTGAYFCFITLSTIGFGDVVPGFSHKEWDDQVKQVACSLYLLIGLSTLAMCFDLMQQRGVKLAQGLGKCVGLVKSKS